MFYMLLINFSTCTQQREKSLQLNAAAKFYIIFLIKCKIVIYFQYQNDYHTYNFEAKIGSM